MNVFEIALGLSILLCTLVGGFLFAWANVVMPGIHKLSDKDFIRAFQVTDGVIQGNDPVFILVWLGSVIALIVTAVCGYGILSGLELYLLMGATLAYLVGVQLMTFVIHLPLNGKLQQCDVQAMNAEQLSSAREDFEATWVRYNKVRTVITCLVSIALIALAILL